MHQADPQGNCIVVGLFDRPEDAMDVMRDLQGRGIPASSIRMDDQEDEEPQVERTLVDKLRELVTGRDTHRFAEGIHRGGTVVSVAVSEAMVEDAMDVMQRHRAVDIEERVETWRA